MTEGRTLAVASAIILSSCSSSQLTYNTIDIATTIDSLYKKQVLNNLSAIIDEPHALPSQVDIQTGTVTTSNTVTPSASFPFVDAWGQTVTAASTITKATTTSLTSPAATIQASQVWQQNWNVLPLTDANTLRNLRTLYRYAVYGINLKDEYLVPRIEKVGGKLSPDPYLIQYPQCVLCGSNETVNINLHTGWLYWTNDANASGPERQPPANTANVDLGHFGNHELFMTKKDYQNGYLSDFILFIMPTTEPSAAAGGGGGAPTAGNPRTGGAPNRPNYGFPSQPVPPI